MRLLKLEINPVEVVFGVVDQGQVRGPIVGDLTCELSANGAAGAGDADPPAVDQGAHGGTVRRDLRATEQVFEADRPHVDVAVDAGAEIGQLRQAGEWQSDLLTRRQQGAEAVGVRIGCREHRALRCRPSGAEPAHDRRQLGRCAQNADAADVSPRLAFVVVHDADDAIARGGAAGGGADEELGPISRLKQQDGYSSYRAAAPQHTAEATIQNRTVDHARPHQEYDQDKPVDEERRAGIALQPRQREEDWHEHQHRETYGLRNEHDIAQRRVAPNPPVDSHMPENQRRDRREQQCSLDDEAARHLPERAEPVAEQQGKCERRAGHGHVVSRDQVRAFDNQTCPDAPHVTPVFDAPNDARAAA